MLRLIWRLGRLLAVLLVLALALYLGRPYLLTAIGRYLVTEHPLAKADLVLVLSGNAFLRVPEAARIYHEGFAPKILLTNEPKERGMDDLQRQGIRFLDRQETAITILEALRIPRSAILTIQEGADSTRSEMLTVARFLKSHPVKRLIIVTSKSHTTRAYKIFATGLEPGIQLIMRPAPDDPFDPTRWWQDRMDAKDVLHEYQALADFWRLRLWAMVVGQFRTVPSPVTVR
ncbi:MAG: YdcF family protein [candidate division NC10 bacterium]|nr:YdcF family protein [candidate division NC10 bacterium]